MTERVARRRHGRSGSPLKPTRLVVPAYTRVDVRLVSQNLLEPRHLEFGPPALRAPVDVPRSVFPKATYGL